ncbi:MAG: Calx-beta domain-containing protein [Opitutaceae bacterium]
MSRIRISIFTAFLTLLVALALVFDRSRSEDLSKAIENSPESPTSEISIAEDVPSVDLDAWLASYIEAPAPVQSSMLPAGVVAAKERAAAIKQLIVTDPAAALENVVTLAEYNKLPAALRPYYETPTSAVGDIDLRWATHVHGDEAHQCSPENRLFIEDQSYTLYGAGRRAAQSPVFDLPVTAYVLDDVALVAESSVLPVAGEELVAAQQLFELANFGGLDPVTQLPVDEAVAAVIAGKVYYFSTTEVRDEVAATIEKAELATLDSKDYSVELPYTWLAGDTGGDEQGITQSSFFADDNISVLFIRCDFSDFEGAPVSKADLEADLATVNGYLSTMSYNTASITATVTTTLYRATGTGTSYAQSGDDDALHADVLAVYDAAPNASPSSAYDVVAIYFPRLTDVDDSLIKYGGLGSVGGSKHWINGLSTSFARTEVITHEFGHNYGLFHSNYWHPEHDLSGEYNGSPDSHSLEYGDIFDSMGSGDLPESHFNQFQKHKIDWLPDSKVEDITVNDTYKIYRFDHIDALDNPLHVLRVPMQDDVFYWVSYRQLFTSNSNLTSGAYVVAEGLYNNRPNLIDMTPESETSESSDRDDAGLPVGDSFYDAESGVTITSVAKGTDGSGDEWITVAVDLESRFGLIQNSYEPYESAGTVDVTVRRLYPNGAITLSYATSDGSAIAGEDYEADSGTLFWADGDDTDRTISITLNTDSDIEGVEDFTITLSDPTPGVLINGEESVTVSILDVSSEIGFVADTYEVDEAAGVAYVTLERSIAFDGVVSVDYATSDDTATAGLDYISATGSVTWSDGESGQKKIAIAIKSDDLEEGIESFDILLSNPVASAIPSGQESETVSILDPGQRYASFTPDHFNNTVETIAFQSDGRAIIAGLISSAHSGFFNAGNIARVDSYGDVDTVFNSGGSGFDAPVNQVAVDQIVVAPDDSIYALGIFTAYNGTSVDGLIRLSSSGALDNTFVTNLGTGANGTIETIALQADGKLLVGGNFTSFNGTSTEGLIRLNANGTVDDSLSLPFTTSWNTYIFDILVQPDDKIMVVGSFYIPGLPDNHSGVARLNLDGTRDTSFDPGEGLHSLGDVFTLNTGRFVKRLADGDYLIMGFIGAFDENAVDNVFRINSDGSFDRTFASTIDVLPSVALAEPFSGGLIIGGDFTTPEADLFRIGSDWLWDSDFLPDGGPDVPEAAGGSVRSLGYAPDGSLWVGGNFFSFNGSGSSPIARIASGVSPYDFWAAGAFTPAQIAAGDADPYGDADLDGIANIGELALGTDPVVADASSVFGSGNASGLSLSEDSGLNYLQMTLDKSALSGGVWYCVQVSSDLSTWSPDPALPGDDSAFEILEDGDSRLVIRDRTPVAPGSPRFVRIVIKQPE